jgi:uncharacterized protein (TIGR02996 family)
MTPNEAFLRDIAENPDEDAPRLVYADWLDDHGQPDRAEFIRVQCLRATLPADDPRAGPLEGRAAELLRNNWEAWVGPLRALVGPYDSRRGEGWLAGRYHPDGLWKFRRGFVDNLALDALTFVLVGDEVFRRTPLRHLRVWEAGGAAEALAASPHLALLATLTFPDYFSAPLTADGALVLASSPYLTRLAGLDLYRNNVGDRGLEALASAPWLAGLKQLNLVDNGLSAVGARALAVARAPALTVLRLGVNGLGDEGAEALAGSPLLARLTALDLHDCRLGRRAAAALAVSPHLGCLASLDLDRNQIGPMGADSLARAPWMSGVCTLNLSGCRLGDEGVEALGRSSKLSRVSTLGLNDNGASLRGLEALASSPHLPALRSLGFKGNRVTPEVGARLRPRHWAALEL